MDIRLKGDWESWIKFFLKAVTESAEMANEAAQEIHQLHKKDLAHLQKSKPTPYTLQVFNEFCHNPILNGIVIQKKHKSTKPKIQRAFDHLIKLGIIKEISGNLRDRRYSYHKFLAILTRDTTSRIG